MRQIEWDTIRDFLAVARAGSLSGAATRLRVNASTVSRRIEALETRLGVRLFQRSQTGYLLTDEAQALLQRAEAVEYAATAFVTFGSDQETVSGHVRLATSENHANFLLLPALPGFRDQYPDLHLEIVTDNRSVNLHRREADLALRLVQPDRGNLTVKKVGEQTWSLYANPAYLETHPWVPDGGLGDHSIIAWTDDYAALPAAQWMEAQCAGRAPALRLSSLRGQLTAAVAGVGIAALPHFMADQEERLRRLPSTSDSLRQDLFLVTHADLRASARVSAVARFVEEAVSKNLP